MTNVKVFNNFKVHTQYSICEGAIKIDELANYCKEKKIKALGICDSYNLCGALEFSEKISKIGTQPIIGTQINFSIDDVIGKLPLFAKSQLGYKNIIKLSSESYLGSDQKSDPHCDFTRLTRQNEDLILLSGNHLGLFGKLYKLNKLKLIEKSLENLKNIFGSRFYLEIQRHNDPQEKSYENYLIQISNKIQIPLIATQEVFYLGAEMYEAHNALTCIGSKSFVDDLKRIRFSDQHFIKTNQDLTNLFSDIPEALENNYNFTQRFSFKPKKCIQMCFKPW